MRCNNWPPIVRPDPPPAPDYSALAARLACRLDALRPGWHPDNLTFGEFSSVLTAELEADRSLAVLYVATRLLDFVVEASTQLRAYWEGRAAS